MIWIECYNTQTGETSHGSSHPDYEENLLSEWVEKMNKLYPYIIHKIKKLDKKE